MILLYLWWDTPQLPLAAKQTQNWQKFYIIVVIVNQCSTINQTANDDDSALATMVLIADAVLNPAYWAAGEYHRI